MLIEESQKFDEKPAHSQNNSCMWDLRLSKPQTQNDNYVMEVELPSKNPLDCYMADIFNY